MGVYILQYLYQNKQGQHPACKETTIWGRAHSISHILPEFSYLYYLVLFQCVCFIKPVQLTSCLFNI